MRDLIISLLGEYTPSTAPDGSVVGGLYSLDLTWIVGAVVFVIAFTGCIILLRTLLNLFVR